MGAFFSWLALARKPDVVVEFGTAFGVSGMYWLAGLEAADHGQLLTFEPNGEWLNLARHNLQSIGKRFVSVKGTFEDNVDTQLQGRRIDMAFVDGIHTSKWVLPQIELIIRRPSPGGLILMDDINFSEDMANCWKQLAHDPRVRASVAVSGVVGLLEIYQRGSH